MAEINLPKCNKGNNYRFMDVLENLALLMIVNKEIEDFIKKQETDEDNIELMRDQYNKEMLDAENKISIGHKL